MGPHDRLFRFTFQRVEYARDALRAILPERLVRRLDFERLTLRSETFVDPRLTSRISDVMYSAPIDGTETFVWIVCEHQSTEVEVMALRLLEYMVGGWSELRAEGLKHVPPIVPVVITHVRGGWRSPRRFSELYGVPPAVVAPIRRHLVDFEYIVDDIGRCSERALARRTSSPFLRLVLWSLRAHARGLPASIDGWVEEFRRLRQRRERDRVEALLRYHLEVGVEDGGRVVDAAIADPWIEEVYVTSLKDILLEEGRERGLEQGRREGLRSALLSVLTLKFGEVPAAAQATIDGGTAEQLEAWTKRVLDASSVEDVLRP